MKKITVIFLVLALLACHLPAAAQEPFTYELRDDGAWITGTNVGGDLVLPEELGGAPVVGLADGAFYENSAITSVTLPENLRYIGAQVFTRCTGINRTLNIPDGVEWIEPWSLWTLDYSGKDFSAADRYHLTSVNGVYFSTGALPGFSSVEEDGVVYWLRDGEAELVSIRRYSGGTVILPETVAGCPLTTVGPWCCGFTNGGAFVLPLTHVVVPGTVRRLRAHAFEEVRLQSLYLGEGVELLEPCSLAVGFHETVITVPASAQVVSGPLFTHRQQYLTPTVYAYSGTEAARLAEAEGCRLVLRDAADGRNYGVCAGMQYYIQDGQAAIYDGQGEWTEYGYDKIPEELDGFPVTHAALSVFSGAPGADHRLIIPASITSLTYKAGDLHSWDLLLYYPGTYAESFCKQHGLNSQSLYSYWAPPFDDVDRNSWYYDSVCYVFATGLMFGTGGWNFSPNGDTSRAMLVTVLWRMAGTPAAENASPFADVPPGSWYGAAVAWAYETGVSNGVSETAFAPDAPVTREQIAALLLRYAQKQGMAAEARSDIRYFPDAGRVSGWAVEAMQWARAAGIIKGRLRDGDVFLDPGAKARRCEIAEMLMRFCLN